MMLRRQRVFVAALAIALGGCASPALRTADRPPPSTRGALDGTWKPIKAEMAGRPLDIATMREFRLDVNGDFFTATDRSKRETGRFVFVGGEPPALDVVGDAGPNKGQRLPAIFRRTTTSLQLCYDLSGNGRPSEFKTRAGTQLFCILYAVAQ
jgi:uncharacterized protein (TIGR03067 family)